MNIHPSKMTADQFVAAFTKQQNESEEAFISRFGEQTGIGPIRGACGLLSIAKATKAEKSLKTAIGIYRLVTSRQITAFKLLAHLTQYGVDKVNDDCTHRDGVIRIANLQFEQTQVFMGKDTEVAKQVAKFIETSPTGSAYPKDFVEKNVGTPVMLVKKEGVLRGVGSTLDGNVNYSGLGTSVAPLSFVPYHPAISRLANFCSKFVNFTASTIEIKIFNDNYLRAMHFHTLFTNPANAFKLIGVAVQSLLLLYRDSFPTVAGTGNDIVNWIQIYLKSVLNRHSDDNLFNLLSDLSKAFEMSVIDKDASIGFKRDGVTGKIQMRVTMPGMNVSSVIDNEVVITGRGVTFENAFKVMGQRRNIDSYGGRQASGLSLHYAFSVNLPKEMLDVVSLATDISKYVADKKEIRIEMVGLNSPDPLERMLQALKYVKYAGQVFCTHPDTVKLLLKHDINKGKPNALSPLLRDAKFFNSAFTVHHVDKEAPTIYHVNYGLDMINDLAKYEKIVHDKLREVQAHIKAKNYLYNIPLNKKTAELSGVYVSCEPHNLWGYRTNDTKLVETMDNHSLLMKDFIVAKEHLPAARINRLIMPFNGFTQSYVYYRAYIANVCRAQFFVTGKDFGYACRVLGMHTVQFSSGDLSGIVAKQIMINGMSINTIMNNREMLESLQFSGTDEEKALIKLHVNADNSNTVVNVSGTLVPASVGLMGNANATSSASDQWDDVDS